MNTMKKSSVDTLQLASLESGARKRAEDTKPAASPSTNNHGIKQKRAIPKKNTNTMKKSSVDTLQLMGLESDGRKRAVDTRHEGRPSTNDHGIKQKRARPKKITNTMKKSSVDTLQLTGLESGKRKRAEDTRHAANPSTNDHGMKQKHARPQKNTNTMKKSSADTLQLTGLESMERKSGPP